MRSEILYKHSLTKICFAKIYYLYPFRFPLTPKIYFTFRRIVLLYTNYKGMHDEIFNFETFINLIKFVKYFKAVVLIFNETNYLQ